MQLYTMSYSKMNSRPIGVSSKSALKLSGNSTKSDWGYLMQGLREIFFSLSVRTGIARLNSFFNRDKLIILCFHSISQKDEHQFWPGVFISKEKVTRLLDYLQSSHFNVISLQDAERYLRGEAQFKYPVVITFDDGWRSSVTDLLPMFLAYNFPVTIYVTTYYCDHEIPVVNVLVQYWLWLNPTDGFDVEYGGTTRHFSGDRSSIVKAVELSLKGLDDEQKIEFLLALADSLGVSGEAIKSKRFHNATYEELAKAMLSPLVDMQLHTHTHQLPTDNKSIEKEIQTNKNRMLETLSPSNPLVHFCYPSGIWSPEHLPELEAIGIKTATTLDEGINAKTEHPLKLKRNLVMDHRTLDHFVVTISGVLDALRRVTGKASTR